MEDTRKVRHDNSGFTLVELVVVIAILGILAGVAYAGYGGYLEYAKRAGDEDIIAAVNAAFASACEEQGVERTEMQRMSADVNFSDSDSAETAETEVAYVNGLTDVELNSFKDKFNNYYLGNKNSKLKYYHDYDVVFMNGTDMFSVDQEIGKDRNDFSKSNFGKSPETAKDLLKKLQSVQQVIGDVMSKTGVSADLFEGIFGVDQEQLKAQLLEEGYITNESDPNDIANGVILYTAKKFGENDPSTLKEAFANNGDGLDNITGLALGLGMATAYYNSPSASDEFKAAFEATMSLDPVNDTTNFALGLIGLDDKMRNDTYYADYQEKYFDSDLNGLIAALSVMNREKDTITGYADKNSSFNNEDTLDMLKKYLGFQ